tara:strand:- start:41155 stop:41715 length:561 start_codon:yes stop_codon:yes gene_type:complete
MGATLRTTTVQANSMQEAWKMVNEEAEAESGRGSYNGDFNTTSFTQDVTRKYHSIKGIEKADEWIQENVPKWETWGVCLKEKIYNTNKIKSTVERNPQKGARKWVTKYVGIDTWNHKDLAIADTLQDCIDLTRAYCEKTARENATFKVEIRKKLKNINEYHCATIKYKKSKTESKGTYLFVGLCSC